MKTLVLVNRKGGAGKTTVATLLTHYFAHQGQRVLAIDFDQQGALTRALTQSKRLAVSAGTAADLLTLTEPRIADGRCSLVPASDALLGLEPETDCHSAFAETLRSLLGRAAARFDVCVIDTSSHPDVCLVSALWAADFVLCPLPLTQEAVDVIQPMLRHDRFGIYNAMTRRKLRLRLIGLLPTMVERTPNAQGNFGQAKEYLGRLLIPLTAGNGEFAFIPRRSVIEFAQSEGAVLWELKCTAARDAWREIKPSIEHIANVVTGSQAVQTV